MYAINFPFIKEINFFKLDCPNDEYLNRRMKREFFMFLNCRKYRHMHLVRHGAKENPYCVIELNEHVLHVQANCELIKIFLDAMKKFENINLIPAFENFT